MPSWHRDFKWSRKGVIVKETGASVRFDRVLFYDIYRWGLYTAVETLRNIKLGRKPIIVAYPSTIRPWYLLWAIINRAGAKIVSPENASQSAMAAIHFEDQTLTKPENPPKGLRAINFACVDISKTHVSNIFSEVFGEDLLVNPNDHQGLMVVKSENNGAHDGQIINGPLKAEPGFVYQRVIDNETDDGHVADLRCPTLYGVPTLVFIKERPVDRRFDNLNTRCRIARPEDCFSADELAKISQFCQKMRLDFGGLDILRDKQTGRIYIVDVNKTDMGPPFALPLKEKLRAVDIIAQQFQREVFGQKED